MSSTYEADASYSDGYVDPALCGWIDNPPAVQSICADLTYKTATEFLEDNNLLELLQMPAENADPVLLYETFRKLPVNESHEAGADAPCGPQKIGDCVSWGWGCANNYAQSTAIIIGKAHLEYQETCTEWIYGSSRVEIGGQRFSLADGSVGAWAAKAVAQIGTLSRPFLEKKLGAGKGAYDPSRAKSWGAKGVPDDLEPDAKMHLFKQVTAVTSFEEAVAMIRLGKAVPVCSNQGFSQTRDENGFCKTSLFPWAHCMCFIAARFDIPGLLCAQSWGTTSPTGPRWRDQPVNTFWVDARTATSMLSRNDSFSPADFIGYEAKDALDYYAF